MAIDASFTHLIAVCGPVWRAMWEGENLSSPAFSNCSKVGLNLSMIEDLSVWNPFDILIERDSVLNARADMAFLAPTRSFPVVGICLVHPQQEYGNVQRHDQVTKILQLVLKRLKVGLVAISTEIESLDLDSPAEPVVESLIANLDTLVTTRLHGMVYALRNGIPPVVIDPIAGGAKVLAQARAIGWPHVIAADMLTEERLMQLIEHCLSSEAREEAKACLNMAVEKASCIEKEFNETVFGSAGSI
ncbi:MAG: polysaccharide pyruvyl transferase family protein [Methylophilales bacterium]|nr:polysaccharide pyruvyl transferase family protein [Methylophilales bacterium]